MTLAARFLAKVDIGAPDECWPWTGGKSRGYGVIVVRGQSDVAHRVSFEHFVRRLKPGERVRQSCGDRSCQNWAHLVAFMPGENTC